MIQLKQYRYAGLLAVVFLLYVGTGLLGLSLSPVGGFATLVWPPTGIAIAALYFGGYRLAPAIALGAFVTNFITGAPFLVAAGIACGNLLEALAVRYALKERYDFNPLFRRLSDSLLFIGVCALAPLIAATIGVLSLLAGSVISADIAPTAWVAWWVGDALGAIVIGAFLIRWIAKPLFSRTRAQMLEAAFAFCALIVANVMAQLNPFPLLSAVPVAYFFVPFLWLSIREGARGITLASLITAAFLVWDSVQGIGVFSGQSLIARLFLSQLLLGMLAVIFLVIASAMEERRRINIALAGTIEKLERALWRLRNDDRAKTEFIAILAHELRNPLAPLISSLELLRQEGLARVDDDILTIMDKSTRTMRRLLDDLLDISRLSRRGFKLQKQQVDLAPIIHSSVSAARNQATAEGHVLTEVLPKDALWVSADPLRIEQALSNLLSNAVKYTPPGGRIDIVCERKSDEAIVRVRDTGIGIAPGQLPNIFEPFQRDRNEEHYGKGLGIGLSLSKKLAELHGGSLTAESDGKGLGSTFTLRLPLLQVGQLAITLHEQPQRDVAEYPRLDIVVVDDNAPAAEALAKLLRAIGHRADVCMNGEEAVSYVAAHRPDAAFVDIGLPDIDGHTVARRIRKTAFKGTLVALSGYGQPEDKARARSSGFHHHLTKPASLAEIEAILRTVPSRAL